MAAGLYVIPAGADAWASYIDQAITALNDGWVLVQSGTDATGGLATTCSFATSTTFQITGDQTSNFVPGRRMRIVHAGGTTYTEVATSVFGAVTTVTIGGVTSGPVIMTTPITSVALGIPFPSATVGNYSAALPWQVLTRTTTTVVASTNSATADSTLFTYTVPAALLGSSGILRLTCYGDYLNNSGGNLNTAFKFLVGTSTVLAQTTAVTAGSSLVSSANRRYWDASILLQNAGSASAQRVFGKFALSNPTTQVFTIDSAANFYVSEGYATSAEASTAAMTIAWLVRVTSTATTVDCQLRGAVLEFAP
jgi:hypothetical protein